MNYKKIYDSLILKAQFENRSKSNTLYYERHHIIPTALGGPDTIENKVLLTAREHFIAHWLLYKICKGIEKSKMAHAWFSMSRKSDDQERLKISSRKYEIMKRAHSIAASDFHKGKKLTESQVKLRKYNNPNSKKIIFKDVCFLSISAAADYFGVTSNVIRKYIKNDLPYEYLVDLNFRKKLKDNNISKSLKGKNKGKSYIEMYGEEKSKELIEKRKLAKLGSTHSAESRKKLSAARRGKPSWNKGKQFNEESRKKMSESRKGDSRSNKSYKIIDPSGKEYVVEKKGLPWFWNNILNEKFPTSFKKVSTYKEGLNGKWKGWKVYVLPQSK